MPPANTLLLALVTTSDALVTTSGLLFFSLSPSPHLQLPWSGTRGTRRRDSLVGAELGDALVGHHVELRR